MTVSWYEFLQPFQENMEGILMRFRHCRTRFFKMKFVETMDAGEDAPAPSAQPQQPPVVEEKQADSGDGKEPKFHKMACSWGDQTP